jgi:predicted transcriptional regulator
MSQIDDKVVEDKILEMLSEEGGLKMEIIMRKLKKHGFDKDYVDVEKYLNNLMDSDEIIREEVKGNGPWYYCYKLNKNYSEK